MSENKGKDTIYIDVDEEITGIVSKIQNSPKDIVALVLPKRANVLQSIVNMKLIKRTADQNDKKVVLITSESRLLPLAGASGLFVAANLTSKPYLPPSPKIDGQELAGGEEGAIDPNTPVSQVAPDAKFADDNDAIEIDNRPKPEPTSAAKNAKPKKKKGLKVPNFGKFRTRLIIGIVAALFLISGIIYALFIAPKATVTLKAQTSELPINVNFIADTAATEFDKEGKVVRAIVKETQKQDSEKVPATGQKDKGNKASGTVTLKNCKKADGKVTIPAGTGVSSGEFTFVTTQAVTLDASVFSGGGTTCLSSSTKEVPVIAQQPGDKYNLSVRDYTVSGHSGVTGTGSSMTGGTSQIVTVVSQSDIDKAKERLNSKQNTVQDEIRQDLKKEGYIAITDSFQATPSEYIPSPAVDAEASEVTVNVTTTYKMTGVKEEDLKELVKQEVSEQQKDRPQNVLSEGLETAVFKASSASGRLNDTQTAYSVNTTVVTGPDINEEDVKNQITGKKKGQAEEILKQKPGVIEPSVRLSPFWVSKIPKASKITIEVKQADGSAINP
ncbi:hypothetical protein HZB74_04015 [Candidatus Saccharibacteria bacterium]|nr:hypothetical protein [Candidatus Saccharibacteria bacterium]